MTRPNWHQYFMGIAEAVSLRSTCLRRRVGAIIVCDKHIVATGYNGSPAGTAHCSEKGCLRETMGIPSGERHEICRGAHAEANAIAQAAQHGACSNGCTLYCTNMPCSFCAKSIINAGIVRVVYRDEYPDDVATELLREAGVGLMKVSDTR